jgi:alkaline phosphatase D
MDPDLLALHRNYPMICIWDDHEIANDTWQGGAQNHSPKTEGPWSERSAAARQAYFEWLPMRGRAYRTYDFGDLATIVTLDTRLSGRTEQLTYSAVLKGVDTRDQKAVVKALQAFRDGPWADKARTMLGAEQEVWLDEALQASKQSGRRWQVLAQQVIVGRSYGPKSFLDALPEQTPDWLKARVQGGVLAASVGLPVSADAWSGYPAARARLVNSLRTNADNAVVLAGDSHNAWAYDLYAEDEYKSGANPAAVEFAGHSVSSPGLEAYMPIAEEKRTSALIESSPELRWINTQNRGYMAIHVTPENAACEWRFTGAAGTRSTALVGSHKMQVRARGGAGSNKLERV